MKEHEDRALYAVEAGEENILSRQWAGWDNDADFRDCVYVLDMSCLVKYPSQASLQVA